MLNAQIRLEESQLEVSDGRRVNYARGPENGPPLLLIHGITGRWQDWESVIPGFVEDWQIYALDLRGHGKSDRSSEGYHWRGFSLDQIEFIGQVVGNAVYMIGHSLGASTALGVAAERPDLVRAVVYEDPPLFVYRRWEDNHFRQSFVQILDVLDSDPSESRLAAALKEMQPDHEDDYYRERAEKLLSVDREVLRTALGKRARTGWLSEDLLPKATSPGLLLQADPEMGAALWDDEAEEAVSLLPNAETEKWEGCGHGMHGSYPERFVERANRFLRRY